MLLARAHAFYCLSAASQGSQTANPASAGQKRAETEGHGNRASQRGLKPVARLGWLSLHGPSRPPGLLPLAPSPLVEVKWGDSWHLQAAAAFFWLRVFVTEDSWVIE